MAVTRRLRPEIAAGFLAPYDSWRHRVALHRFVQDIPMGPAHPSWSTLKAIEQSLAAITCPLLFCWGGADFCFDRSFYDEWRRRFPAAEAHFFDEAGHYVLEDALAETLPPIERFLATTVTIP
jgi:haloalkane dehalogenase